MALDQAKIDFSKKSYEYNWYTDQKLETVGLLT